MKKRKKLIKRIIGALAIIFIFMNVLAYLHAYKFTHFADSNIPKTQSAEKLSALEKVSALIMGVNNPRPTNKIKPDKQYQTIKLQSNQKIECWYFKQENPAKTDTTKGTIILFHGYGGNKAAMLDKVEAFGNLKYDTFVVDFMGSGGSEGNVTTIGYKEAAQVKTAYEYLAEKGVKNIYLFGTSMGAVAIMKAINDYQLKPQGIMLECPFGSMYQTVCARFTNMNAPCFPMASFLVFWGGVQNGFWAFGHNPTEYAKKITSPTLLMYGNLDKNVSRAETNAIFENPNCKKNKKSI